MCEQHICYQLERYNAYCQTFNLPHFMQPTSNRIIAGIGGKSKATGVVGMQVIFRELEVLIDVQFFVMKEKILTLLSMTDMLDHGLDISFQEAIRQLCHKKPSAGSGKLFLIYR